MIDAVRILRLPHLTAVATDVAALIVFVTIGLFAHHGGVTAGGYARTALPLVACWLVAGGAFDLYRRPRLGALALTWACAVPVAVAIRALVVWHAETGDAVFLGVALCFTALFVLVARTAVAGLRAA